MKGKSQGQECSVMPRAILSSLGPQGLSIPQGPGGVGCGSSAGRTRGLDVRTWGGKGHPRSVLCPSLSIPDLLSSHRA